MDTRVSEQRLRVQHVQDELAARGWHALLVPSADPHLSEYLPAHWQARQWLSGFTGSMGTLVITIDHAAVFADSRYWVQAEAELAGTGIELVKIESGAATTHVDWLARHTPPGGTVAVDGAVLSLAAAHQLQASLEAAGAKLHTGDDLVDAVWPDRPALPMAAVYEHLAPHATTTRAQKLQWVRQAMAAAGATRHFVSTVDDIAWITNLRGADVTYNPVFLAHLLIDADRAQLFVDERKFAPALVARLAADGITLAPYADARQALAALTADDVLLLDPKRVTLGLREAVGRARVTEAINPSTLHKSRKTDAEAAHIREAMAEDGAAMCEFYAWFEAALARAEPMTELTVDEHLSAARARRAGFVGLSFPVIAGYNANGAMPHYRATPDSHAAIEGDGLLLIDSGGQYLGGTTDITRVWPIGTLSDAMRRDYTLVLKGTMQLSRARFPVGTLSPMLDALARAPLWAEGLDFGHGTGHGVGYFLNVHEGPQSISKAIPTPHMAMQPGMITSIEPGLYRPGQWGVRIENLVLNVPAESAEGDAFGSFLAFETLTLCPIDTRCIDRRLMRADEIDWLNAYHATVRERLAPRVDGAAKAWLFAHGTDLNDAAPLRLGIDLGGTKIEAAVLDAAGATRWRERVPTPTGDYEATLDAVAGLIARAEAAVATTVSVGIGHPGSSTASGHIKNANSTCLNGQPLQADLEARTGRRMRLANDANCLALSEATDGAGAGAGVVFAVILGTGVGAGIAVDGRVLHGANGLAGEWGHNPLPWADSAESALAPACYCGQRGCIETWLSGPGLARDHQRHTGQVLTAKDIAQAAAAGDAAAQATLARHTDRLARALAGVINLLDPDVIVLGGGLSQLQALYPRLPPLWTRRVFSAGADEPLHTRLRPAAHGDASGVRGAAWLWR